MLLEFSDAYENLRYAVSLATPGVALEFGVYSGNTLSLIRAVHTGPVIGFDSFKGLPETWRNGFEQGHFATNSIPVIDGAEIVIGLFKDTLPGTLAKLEEPISFVHFDADLYSSTAFALSQISFQLADTCIFVFDEYQNYPGWEDHEYRAFKNWMEDHPTFNVEPISIVPSHEQATFKVTRKKGKK